MDILIIMSLGILIGRLFLAPPMKKIGEMISIMCTFLLIFSMGVRLGKNENLLNDLASLGLSSLLFFLIPTACSILLVFVLTKKLMAAKDTNHGKEDTE